MAKVKGYFPSDTDKRVEQLEAKVQELEARLTSPIPAGDTLPPPGTLEELTARVQELEARLARAEQGHDRDLYQVQARIGTFPWKRLSEGSLW